MKDRELSSGGKAAFGGLCAACCGLPMLVTLGIVSVGIAVTTGAAIASVFAIVFVVYQVVQRGAMRIPVVARRVLVAVGVGLSGVGLLGARAAADFAPAVLSISLAVLATAALLVLASADSDVAVG